ncbi:hypothetical protein N2152v2_007902 [Parachlorella kessleri]
MFELEAYSPPAWASSLSLVPNQRVLLAQLPTPIHRWAVPGLPEGVELWIKRDDLTGCQLSGNKVRKLEFLLAEALQQGYDCVVTVGGIQSNHCRATAVACRYLGLECHLVLRNSAALVDADPGLVGNLLVDRLVGAHIHQISKEEYGQYGGQAVGQKLADLLTRQGKKPYLIPVGGSSPLGCWGYLEMIRELEGQIAGQGFTDVAMKAEQGGVPLAQAGSRRLTAQGCVLPGRRVHAAGVCDDAAYFYSYIDGLYDGLGAARGVVGTDAQRSFHHLQARGAGYAISKEEELVTTRDVALATGVILDPVYTGKGLHALLQKMRANPAEWAGRKVLFVHTGGLLGLYDKLPQLQGVVQPLERCHRLQLD